MQTWKVLDDFKDDLRNKESELYAELNPDPHNDVDKEYVADLQRSIEDLKSTIEKYNNGTTFIHADQVVDFFEEELEESLQIPHYLVVDWEKTTENLLRDYELIWVDGEMFYVRK